MTPYAAVVDLFDNRRPPQVAGDAVYAGETRLFVLADERLEVALERLVWGIEAKESDLQRVHSAGRVEDIGTTQFPFDVDLDAMAADAKVRGEICVSPGIVFETYPAPQTGVFWGMFEFFNPRRAGEFAPYGGEFRWAAAYGKHAGDALRAVLGDLQARDLSLKSVTGLAHAIFFDRETNVDGRSLQDVANTVLDGEGVVWSSGASFYSENENG